MKTLLEDLESPLNEVDRWYLRIPATIIISPLMIAIFVIFGIFEGLVNVIEDFTYPCLVGKK
jgi:hypothetical protein